MKCSRCNNELLDDVKYCPFCGEQVHKPMDRAKSNNSFFFLALVLHCCISSIIAVEVSDLLHNINYRLEFTIGLLFVVYLIFVAIDLGMSSYSSDTKVVLAIFSFLIPIVYIYVRSKDINIKVFLLWLLGCVVSVVFSISISSLIVYKYPSLSSEYANENYEGEDEDYGGEDSEDEDYEDEDSEDYDVSDFLGDTEFNSNGFENLLEDMSVELKYYEVKKCDSYTNIISDFHTVITVVSNSNNKAISINTIIRDKDGKVLDTGECCTNVAKGQKGVLDIILDSNKLNIKDINDYDFQFTVEEYTPLIAASDCFKIKDYNVNGDTLYVTVKATSENVDSFSGIGALFYKNGKLIDMDEGYVGDWIDGESIIELQIWDKTYDKVVFYYH